MRNRRTVIHRHEDSVRREVEDAIAHAVADEFAWLWRTLYPGLRRIARKRPKPLTKSTITKTVFGGTGLWDTFQNRLESRLLDALRNNAITLAQVTAFYEQMENASPWSYQDWDSSQAAEQLAQEIRLDVRRIRNHTRRSFGRLLNDWYQTEGATLKDLIEDVTPFVGTTRAETIAGQSVSRLNSAITRERMERFHYHEWVWETRRDELVCRICRQKHGHVYRMTDPMPPDGSHIGCRCSPRILTSSREPIV